MYCLGCCICKGRRGEVQKLFCKTCRRWQQTAYCKRSYSETEENIVRRYHNEGSGISSIARLMKIPKTSVQLLMERKARRLKFHSPNEKNQTYLVDELQTFVGENSDRSRNYVISVMNKRTGQIIESIAGKRKKSVLASMIERMLSLEPARVETDGWNGYRKLIPRALHRTLQYAINRLERFHLTLRQRIKRLGRKTLSFSKSERMLEVSVKLFCCGE